MNYLNSTSLGKLEKIIDNEKNPAIRQRLLLVWHIKKGKTQGETGNIFRMPKSTVSDWMRRFKRFGIKGLYRKPGSGGHNRYLTKEQGKQLQDKLKEEPMSTKEVLVYIKETYGRQYHPNSIPRLLKRLGQSLITPRKRHYKANPRSGWAFKGHIKKVEAMED